METTGDDKIDKFFGETVIFMNNKIISRRMYEQVPYCTRRFIEDTQVIVPQLYLANKVRYIDCAGYHYRMQANSLTHTANKLKNVVYRTLCLRDLYDFFKDKPKGGWAKIINFHNMVELVNMVIGLNPTLDEVKAMGPDALNDWADFTTMAFNTIKKQNDFYRSRMVMNKKKITQNIEK